MLVAGIQWRIQSKVNPYAAAHDLLAIYLLTYRDCGLGIEKGHNYTAERFEWRPSVYWCVVVDGFPNLDEVRRVKDLGFNKIRNDESI